MKILLTGAAGFVGTNLAKRLQRYDVVGVDLNEPREIFSQTIIVGDLLNRQFLDKLFQQHTPDVVLHFAAQARVDPSLTDPIHTYRTNVEATINLLEQAKNHKSRFIYASSEIIYGDQDQYPCKEHYVLKPDSPYAASKAATDYMVQQMRGVNTVVLRSGMGFGERSPPAQVTTKMILNCMDDKPLLFPKKPVTHPTRDINYIGNFVNGIVNVLEHPAITGVFNMGSGKEVDMLTLAEQIIKVVGKGSIKQDENYVYREGEEGKRTWLDNSKASTAFGYNPSITLEEGLKRTYDWLKNGREFYGW